MNFPHSLKIPTFNVNKTPIPPKPILLAQKPNYWPFQWKARPGSNGLLRVLVSHLPHFPYKRFFLCHPDRSQMLIPERTVRDYRARSVRAAQSADNPLVPLPTKELETRSRKRVEWSFAFIWAFLLCSDGEKGVGECFVATVWGILETFDEITALWIFSHCF